MKHLKYLLIAFSLLIASQADAATCFWVGGTGTWDTTTGTHWAVSSGGTASTCAATGGIPKQAGDIATFDGSSGGGTVTVASAINGVTLAQIVMGAFTGTLDFSANNPSITLTAVMNISGSGTRTLNCGTGTFTLSAASGTAWDATTVTGLTLSCASASLNFANTSPSSPGRTFVTGGQTYGAVTVSAATTTANNNSFNFSGNTASFSSLTLTGPLAVTLPSNTTYTLANAPTWTGTAAKPILVGSSNISATTPQITFSITSGQPALNWVGLSSVKFTVGTSGTCTNCFDLSNNSGITVNAPSVGGGGHIIGG